MVVFVFVLIFIFGIALWLMLGGCDLLSNAYATTDANTKGRLLYSDSRLFACGSVLMLLGVWLIVRSAKRKSKK